MGAPARQRLVDEADYLAAERDAEVRHEYVDGVLFAMTGARSSWRTSACRA